MHHKHWFASNFCSAERFAGNWCILPVSDGSMLNWVLEPENLNAASNKGLRCRFQHRSAKVEALLVKLPVFLKRPASKPLAVSHSYFMVACGIFVLFCFVWVCGAWTIECTGCNRPHCCVFGAREHAFCGMSQHSFGFGRGGLQLGVWRSPIFHLTTHSMTWL